MPRRRRRNARECWNNVGGVRWKHLCFRGPALWCAGVWYFSTTYPGQAEHHDGHRIVPFMLVGRVDVDFMDGHLDEHAAVFKIERIQVSLRSSAEVQNVFTAWLIKTLVRIC